MERKQYNILLNSYFESKKGRKLSALGLEHVGIAMYLLTISSQVGLTQITKESLISKFNISKRKLNGLFADLEEIGFMKYCDKYSVLYIIDMLAINVKATDNQNTKQARILRAQLALIDNGCELKKELCLKYKDTHSAIINKNLIKEEKPEVEKDEVFDGIQAIHTYNLATDGKGYKRARITDNTRRELAKLIAKGMTREDFINYTFILEFNNIRELIESIKYDKEMQEIENLIDDNQTPQETEIQSQKSEEEYFESLSLDTPIEANTLIDSNKPIEDKKNTAHIEEIEEVGAIAKRQQQINEEREKLKSQATSIIDEEVDGWF